MASFFHSDVREFLSLSEGELLARLEVGYANRGFVRQYTDQTITWSHDLISLRKALTLCAETSSDAKAWGILLEFSIPRKTHRIDVVLLIRDVIVILEAKASLIGSEARRQVEGITPQAGNCVTSGTAARVDGPQSRILTRRSTVPTPIACC